MNSRRLLAVLHGAIALVLGACVAAPRRASDAVTSGACAWTTPAALLHAAGDTVYQVWTIPAARAEGPWGPVDVPALAAFRRDIADSLAHAGIASDPERVTQRVLAFYGARPDRDSREDAENGRQVLAGTAGVIRPLSCVEALVFDHQARRYSMTRQPTEFHVFLLKRPDADTGAGASLLVYFAASSAPWPPRVGRLVTELEARRREGWQVVTHLHNHPFYLDKLRPDSAGRPTADIAGGMAPSATDVQFYRSMREGLGLGSARVTNGFATLEMSADAFGRLRARGEGVAP